MMEAYEVEDALSDGESRVTTRTIAEYKREQGIDARTFIDTSKLMKTQPVQRSWVEHVRLRHPEAPEVLDLARCHTTKTGTPCQEMHLRGPMRGLNVAQSTPSWRWRTS